MLSGATGIIYFSYCESNDFATAGRKQYPAKTRLKSPKVVNSESKSSPKSSKEPKSIFRVPTATSGFFAQSGNTVIDGDPWRKLMKLLDQYCVSSKPFPMASQPRQRTEWTSLASTCSDISNASNKTATITTYIGHCCHQLVRRRWAFLLTCLLTRRHEPTRLPRTASYVYKKQTFILHVANTISYSV